MQTHTYTYTYIANLAKVNVREDVLLSFVVNLIQLK